MSRLYAQKFDFILGASRSRDENEFPAYPRLSKYLTNFKSRRIEINVFKPDYVYPFSLYLNLVQVSSFVLLTIDCREIFDLYIFLVLMSGINVQCRMNLDQSVS